MDYSAPLSRIPTAARRPFRWLKRLVVGFAVILAVLGVLTLVARFVILQIARAKTAEFIAKLDRDDPDWRLEQIEAKRRVYPEAMNSATPLLVANRLIPENWPEASATKLPKVPVPKGEDQASLIAQLLGADPLFPPDENQIAALRAELDALAPALAEARKVVDKPEGRYILEWALNPLDTLLPHAQKARHTARLLRLDSILRVHGGDADGALASCRAALNVGRSLGDEPLFVSQLVRMDIETVALRSIEHVLAFGEPSEEALAAFQGLIEDEEAQPLLRISVRGERTACSDLYSRLASGELRIVNGKEFMPPLVHWLYGEAMLTYAQRVVLEEMSEAVAIADAPLSQQEDLADRWEQGVTQRSSADMLEEFSRLLLPAVTQFVKAYVASRTRLRTAIVAVAAERYRRKHGQWPESVEQLTPWPLSNTLSDPHTDGALIWLRSDEALVIYSPGPDLVDNGGGTLEQDPPPPPVPKGQFREVKPYWEGKDIGFRLKAGASRKPIPSVSNTPPN